MQRFLAVWALDCLFEFRDCLPIPVNPPRDDLLHPALLIESGQAFSVSANPIPDLPWCLEMRFGRMASVLKSTAPADELARILSMRKVGGAIECIRLPPGSSWAQELPWG